MYDITANLQKSSQSLVEKIKAAQHASLITEIKFSSPSLGEIRETSDPAEIAAEMIAGGADAISVLTQPYLFNGSPDYFIRVRKSTDIPMLMKDIIIDDTQINAAHRIGADYILLIQSLYDKKYLKDIDEHIKYSHKYGLGVLLEVHTKSELENALKTDADIIGINNRNLDTLEVDINTTQRVLEGEKIERPIIAESGIEGPQDIVKLKNAGACGFLVGSGIMKTDNIKQSVKDMVEAY